MNAYNFEGIYTFIRYMEGGYSNVTYDRGGETFYGLTRDFLTDNNIPIPPSEQDIVKGYRIVYEYLKHPTRKSPVLDEIPYEPALIIFDLMFHHGKTLGIKKLQKVLNVKQDGKYGIITHEALMRELKKSKFALCMNLLAEKQDIIASILQSDKTQHKFAAGWARRVASLLREASGNKNK